MRTQNKTASDGETYTKLDSMRQLDRWAKAGGWRDGGAFLSDMGVDFSMVSGQWFMTCHGRLYIANEDDFD